MSYGYFLHAYGDYVANMVEFDGVNDRIGTEGGYSADGGTQHILSFTFRIPTAWPETNVSIFEIASAVGDNQIVLNTASFGRFSFVQQSSGVMSYVSDLNLFEPDVWYTVVCSFDSASGVGMDMWYKPEGGVWTQATWQSSTFTVGQTLLATTRCRVHKTAASAAIHLGDFWHTVGEWLDFSIAANRDKFLPTVSKGLDGSIPTGNVPDLFLSGTTSSWHLNKGSGGGLELTGELSTVSYTPTASGILARAIDSTTWAALSTISATAGLLGTDLSGLLASGTYRLIREDSPTAVTVITPPSSSDFKVIDLTTWSALTQLTVSVGTDLSATLSADTYRLIRDDAQSVVIP